MDKPTNDSAWYHAISEFGDTRKRHWWNRSRDLFVEEVLQPLLSKQVVAVRRRGRSWLFNFGSVSYIEILKSQAKLKRRAPGELPLELEDETFIKDHSATKEFIDDIRRISSRSLSRSLLQKSLAKPKKQIFVVMKFGDKLLDSAYQGVIKPVGEQFNFEVIRVDEIPDSGNITEQILENISRSELVLVELTGERPNCYYEAGFAHAIGKELILCITAGQPIHFDLMSHRFIQWTTEQELREALRVRLDAYISKDSD